MNVCLFVILPPNGPAAHRRGPSHGRIAAGNARTETWQRTGPRPVQRRVGQRRHWNTCTHLGVHYRWVKRRELEKRLSDCGWRFLRSGGRHDVWTDGEREEAIPRHREVNEQLAKAILRRACGERI